MCREELLGQKAEAEDDGGEEDEDEEEGGGTALPAAASAASDWLGGPNILAWLASLEKLLYRGDKVTDDVEVDRRHSQSRYLWLGLDFCGHVKLILVLVFNL